MNLGEIERRIAVVTGASSGIGREIARALADTGATVAALARNRQALDRLSRSSTGRVHPYPCDVTDAKQVNDTYDQIASQLGYPTILVAAAGIATFGNTLETPYDDWILQINTNLTGTYLCNVAAIRHMLGMGGGDIVNVLSIAAVVGLPGAAGYSASKAGALGLTRSLNAEFRSQGIRISALIPGATDTPLWDSSGSDIDRRRMMRSEDVSQTVLWMLQTPGTASIDEIHLMPREGIL